jgi:hypothetical protein
MRQIDYRTADYLTIADYSALGDLPVLVVPAARYKPAAVPIQSVVIGLDETGDLPMIDPADFDLLLTVAANPPAPWVGVRAGPCEAVAATISKRVREYPLAATILCQTLKLSEALPFAQALVAESFAYSTLLGGGEFATWLTRRTSCAPSGPEPAELVRMERKGDAVTLTLDHPASRNAMNAAMRDALYGALANTLDDPSAPDVVLQGAGKCFSTGGDLAEFGTARDLAVAHAARTLHANARMCHVLGNRLQVIFHGACIGSGLEVPAAAARRVAREGAFFQLPELQMGLIPGAGGTVSVGRAIGRHRTAWMVLSGARINTAKALDWGLIHQVLPQ